MGAAERTTIFYYYYQDVVISEEDERLEEAKAGCKVLLHGKKLLSYLGPTCQILTHKHTKRKKIFHNAQRQKKCDWGAANVYLNPPQSTSILDNPLKKSTRTHTEPDAPHTANTAQNNAEYCTAIYLVVLLLSVSAVLC